MVVAVYVGAFVVGCCAIWLIVASAGLMPKQSRNDGGIDLSWRRILPPVIASAASAATLLIIRFVEAEAPVAPWVVIRGWVGLFCILGIVSAASAGLMMILASGVRYSRKRGKQEPAAG